MKGNMKIGLIVSVLLIILSLYFLTSLEFVETLPETCGLKYPADSHFNCSLAHFLSWISLIILLLSILYIIFFVILKLRNR